MDEHGLYFIKGGKCNESDVWRFNRLNFEFTLFQESADKAINTSAFNPKQGRLYTQCDLSESNILIME